MAEIVGFVGGFCLPPSTPGRTGKQSSTIEQRLEAAVGGRWKRRARTRTHRMNHCPFLFLSLSPSPSPPRRPADEMFGSLSSSWWRFRWFGRRWFKVVRINRWRRVNDVVGAKTGICSSWRILLENVIREEGGRDGWLLNICETRNLVFMEFSEDYIGDEEDWINFFFFWGERYFGICFFRILDCWRNKICISVLKIWIWIFVCKKEFVLETLGDR